LSRDARRVALAVPDSRGSTGVMRKLGFEWIALVVATVADEIAALFRDAARSTGLSASRRLGS
jgi:hypothetical protein